MFVPKQPKSNTISSSQLKFDNILSASTKNQMKLSQLKHNQTQSLKRNDK